MSIEAEVKSLYEFCRRAGFDDKELDEIWYPLRDYVRKERFKKKAIFFLGVSLLSLSIYILFNVETIQWHASSIGRILMIKLLPFWDWTVLFNKRCLLENYESLEPSLNFVNLTDCDLCEIGASSPTDFISNTSYDEISNHYLIKSVPVVIQDAHRDWMNSNNPDIDLIDLLLKNEKLQDSNPCYFKTNLKMGHYSDLRTILTKLAENNISNWFFHFQNCDLPTVKVLRTITQRPYFLSPHIPPAHFNWLLMSHKYKTSRFKFLELDPGLIIMSQLMGKIHVQISSRYQCESFCPTKTILLQEGDTLALSNSVWNLGYMPDKDEFNIAILTETEWNDI